MIIKRCSVFPLLGTAFLHTSLFPHNWPLLPTCALWNVKVLQFRLKFLVTFCQYLPCHDILASTVDNSLLRSWIFAVQALKFKQCDQHSKMKYALKSLNFLFFGEFLIDSILIKVPMQILANYIAPTRCKSCDAM